MKKFFSVWFVALLCGFTTAVSASVTVTLNCDPSDVSISGLTPDGGSWVKGENTCTTSYASVTFTAAADKLGKLVVTDKYGYSTPYTPFPNYGVSVYDNYKLEISCWDMSDVRDGSFTLNVADASKFTLTRSDNTTVSLQNGDNTIAFASGSHESGYSEGSFTLRTSESDVLLSVASSTNTNRSNTVNGSVSIYPSKDATVTVYVYKLADIRTASCTVNVDEPSKLSVSRSGQTIYFTETTNKVYFVPTGHVSGYQENQLQLQGSSKWYQLTEGENTVSFADSYYWTVTDGATANVQFNAPDVDVPVKFEGDVDAFAKVEVNGVEVDKDTWSADGYTVKLGSEIALYGDNTNYTLNSLSLTPLPPSSDTYSFLKGSGSYSFTVTETSGYTINLSATKVEPFDIYLTVNHPELLAVSQSSDGSSPYDKEVVDPANPNRLKVTLPGKTSSVYLCALDGCSFDSIKNGSGSHISCYSSPVTIYNVSANQEFSVWINKPERTDTLYVSFDYPEYLSAGGVVQRNNKEVITFKKSYEEDAAAYNSQYKGWNKIAFDPEKENRFYISLYGYYAYIYHNGVLKPGYSAPETSSYGQFTASNNDSIVVNILLSASFNIAGSATVTMVSPVDVDPAKTWYVSPETNVQFRTDGSSVKVNDNDVTADSEGVYTVTISENNTTIAIGAPTPTAIESVTIEKPRNNNVYTLQGILLIQDASEAQIDALPRGLYIINGEKRIVTNRR
ncbi:MAG: hypothetical protein PUK04_06480 [Bacteroidales bacterium]|nr:hypothetical protein [Bacteroidales bacterium]MDY6036410.1 hypothetical protein [Paludibacteraceae bacterium]